MFGALLCALAGCGGGSSSKKNAVAQVILTPASLSLESGQVSDPLQVKALDSAGATATTTFTFNSSNPSLATISPSGLVCGGVWDSTFVSCNGITGAGTPLTGSATITATAQGITSGPVAVSVHPHVSSIVVDPVAAGKCFSQKQTHQFVAHACSSAVTPLDTTGPCAPNAHEISGQIGEFTWSSSSPQVAAVDANGLATAVIPGATGVVASVGSTSSPATSFKTCMPVNLRLHVPGDLTTSATLSLNPATTAQVEADMTDENGTVVNGVPGISLVSNNTAVATVVGPTTTGTVTAVSSGVAGIFAACAPPSCGIGINQPVYSNIFNITVGGASPATTVYVASKDLASASTVIPIDTSKTPPAAGTPVSLPGHPNSFLFSSDGNKAYIGTDAGLVAFGPASNTTTLVGPEAVGTVLAVSPDGNHAIVSNAPNDPNVLNHRLRFFDATNGSLQTFIIHNAVAAAFTPDGSKAYIGATDGNLYVFSPFATLQKLTPGGSFSNVATLPSGSLAFLSGSAGLSSFNVCDNSQGASPATNGAPNQLGSILNTDQIV
ncbi:MAG TPA: Ig-like domain-containing protein, partial [Terriglobales bacterium]|nr:Ig-like domain-containing protein [Terriglobales bacterium]